MSMITYPLNNVEYKAEDAELYNAVRSSGVWGGAEFEAEVSESDTIVKIGEGIAWIANTKFSGKVTALKEPVELNLGVADASYARIDVIAIQFDSIENKTDIVVKKGVASSYPEIPARSTTESLYELYLYSVLRMAGSSVVLKSDITDLRANTEYCGYMFDSVSPSKDLLEAIESNKKDIEGLESGKAPSGYGLGVADSQVITTEEELEATKITGWYWYSSPNTVINGFSFDFAKVYVQAEAKQHGLQEIYPVGFTSPIVRALENGTYGEWEWRNPPMIKDVEYRTTERYNGLPVYTKLVYLGELAASGSNISATVISKSHWLIDFEVFAKFKQYNNSSSQKLPIVSSDGTLQAYAYMSSNSTLAVGSLGASAPYFEAYAVVKYTKSDYTNV